MRHVDIAVAVRQVREPISLWDGFVRLLQLFLIAALILFSHEYELATALGVLALLADRFSVPAPQIVLKGGNND